MRIQGTTLIIDTFEYVEGVEEAITDSVDFDLLNIEETISAVELLTELVRGLTEENEILRADNRTLEDDNYRRLCN